MVNVPTFDEALEVITALPPEQQENLLRVVQLRLAERRRAQIVADVLDAQAEFARGEARVATVDEIMREIGR